MEVEGSSEKLVHVYHNIRRHIIEHSNPDHQRAWVMFHGILYCRFSMCCYRPLSFQFIPAFLSRFVVYIVVCECLRSKTVHWLDNAGTENKNKTEKTWNKIILSDLNGSENLIPANFRSAKCNLPSPNLHFPVSTITLHQSYGTLTHIRVYLFRFNLRLI
jgi:hypothetical protein